MDQGAVYAILLRLPTESRSNTRMKNLSILRKKLCSRAFYPCAASFYRPDPPSHTASSAAEHRYIHLVLKPLNAPPYTEDSPKNRLTVYDIMRTFII